MSNGSRRYIPQRLRTASTNRPVAAVVFDFLYPMLVTVVLFSAGRYYGYIPETHVEIQMPNIVQDLLALL